MIFTPKLLMPEAFATFGNVVGIKTATKFAPMNYGAATGYFDLAEVDVEEKGGRVRINIVKSNAVDYPFTVKKMEYHPFGSQLFYPICEAPFLILVAPPSENLDVSKLELFISDGSQGINYHKGVWHHYLLPLNDGSEFFVVDREGGDDNCIEAELASEVILKID